MKNPLIIYHAQCMDGAAAALAAWLKFGEEAEYRPASYGDPAPTDEEVRGRDVYVLDFSYPRAEMDRLFVAVTRGSEYNIRLLDRGRLLVLDHHRTAQADCEGLPFCTFDMNKSGAVLAWEYFHCSTFGKTPAEMEARVPELFRYVQDRDLWRWELPHSREVSAALAGNGALQDFRALIPIYKHWQESLDTRAGLREYDGMRRALINDGTAILRAQKVLIEQTVSMAEEIEIEYLKTIETRSNGEVVKKLERASALAVTAASLQSEIGNALAIEAGRRGLDPVGVVYRRDGKTKTWAVSLRSCDIDVPNQHPRDDRSPGKILAPDVSAIALSFPGGGGHAKAAGFEVKFLPWVDMDECCQRCADFDPYEGLGEDT